MDIHKFFAGCLLAFNLLPIFIQISHAEQIEDEKDIRTFVFTYPFDLQIMETDRYDPRLGGTSGPADCDIALYQKGKKIAALGSSSHFFRCTLEIDNQNVSRDGINEVIYNLHSGALYGSYIVVIPIIPHTEVMLLDLPRTGTYELVDMDHDGDIELKTSADLTWFVGTKLKTGFPIVVKWNAEHFYLDTNLTRQLNQAKHAALPENYKIPFKVSPSGLEVDWNDMSRQEVDHLFTFAETLMYHLAIGETDQALALIKAHARFSNDAQRYLFLQSIIKTLKNDLFGYSYAWDEIRIRNHWYENAADRSFPVCDLDLSDYFIQPDTCLWLPESRLFKPVALHSVNWIVYDLMKRLDKQQKSNR